MNLQPKHTSFVFPGQGSQTLGMGRDLAMAFPVARQTFEAADSALGIPLSRVMWEGPEAELNDTINTQPALYVHSLAAYRVFRGLYPDFTPAFMAGHSLGELSALAAVGACTFEDGLRLVRRRGELMKRAGELAPGGMAAIIGLEISAVEQACSEARTPDEAVQVANDNCPGQVVISGAKPAVERALQLARAAGARRAVPLAVSIAAHSPLMSSIQADWNATVESMSFGDLEVPVVGNVQALAFHDASEARADLVAQMQSRVRWTESIQILIEREISTFAEIGTGSVLGGLIKRIARTANCYALGKPEDFQALE